MGSPTKFVLTHISALSANARRLLDQPEAKNLTECDQKLVRLWELHNELSGQISPQSDQRLS